MRTTIGTAGRLNCMALAQPRGDASTGLAGTLILPEGKILAAGSYNFSGEFHAGIILTRHHGR